MNKICYTAIIGPYDDLKEVGVITPGWDYICFTDQELSSNTWKIIKVIPDMPNNRLARRIKILTHEYLPEAEHTLWLDASFTIRADLNNLWLNMQGYFTSPKHPIRNCLEEEFRSCLFNKRGDVDEVTKQWVEYKRLGLTFLEGIVSSGILMRSHTEDCINLCNAWWAELSQWSTRDQIALCRVKEDFEINYFKFDYSQSEILKYEKHNHLKH